MYLQYTRPPLFITFCQMFGMLVKLAKWIAGQCTVNSPAQINCMEEIGSVVILFVYIDQLSVSLTVHLQRVHLS